MISLKKFKNLSFQVLSLLPDSLYLRFRYRQRVGFWPDLACPRRFSEKLQWLKLNDRQPEMTRLADKLQFKQVITERLGSAYVIPLLASGDNPQSLSQEDLPTSPFVLKTNHDSGGTFVVENPEAVRVEVLREWLKSRMSISCYLPNREWEYKDISPRWFIEPLLRDETGAKRLNDYKIHCFNGEPRAIQTIFDRDAEAKENWFDEFWSPLDISYFSKIRATIDEPVCLEEMLHISREISKPFPYARVDFYIRGNRPLLGETTFRPYGGFMKWSPDEADYLLGDWLDLDT